MQYKVQCYECDSEYTIQTEEGLLSDEPQFCIVCKEKVDVELIDDE